MRPANPDANQIEDKGLGERLGRIRGRDARGRPISCNRLSRKAIGCGHPNSSLHKLRVEREPRGA